jgi:hypothetical protein
LHEDKPLDAKAIMAKTDVISAMEAIEGAALQEKPRKKTPPLSQKEEERKKALIRYGHKEVFPRINVVYVFAANIKVALVDTSHQMCTGWSRKGAKTSVTLDSVEIRSMSQLQYYIIMSVHKQLKH